MSHKNIVIALCAGLLGALSAGAAHSQISSQGTVIQTPQPVAPAVVGLHQMEDAAAAAKQASPDVAAKASKKAANKAAKKAGKAAGQGASKASAKASGAKGKKPAAKGGKTSKKKAHQAAAKRKAH
ncbi:hypothetical protein [Paucibacter sp. DJ2R-2]|uniref:hypothetical protein n=1 Tax=Paucibacter sp. DJ2R-2 TaxID=2893558 RepID=UPI0021E47F7D|nr:hypothetical protein [Paucibacter sp. DJ2R-2]MCV2423146.1 hypothetical protein [Paucibacter sp. DJ4R-1]MCV2440602.1 hypothetical protein [Paucibacter sp. DJ2R-2]